MDRVTRRTSTASSRSSEPPASPDWRQLVVGMYDQAGQPKLIPLPCYPSPMGVGMPIPNLSDGITESLINNLAHVPQLKVKSRNLVFHYKGKDVDAQKVGSELGVSALVNGRVVPRGDKVEVSAELTDVRDNTIIWGQHYSGKGADIISLQQQIAGDIAAKLRSNLNSSEKQQVTKQGTQNPEAYELYLKGRYEWNKRTVPG